MATQVQNRRGTTAEHSTFTGAVGELTVDTTKDTVVVHDGAVAGGRPLLREDQSNLPTSAPTTGIYNASGSLAISTGGSGRLFVDASGNVGVGSVPSSSRFYVNGALETSAFMVSQASNVTTLDSYNYNLNIASVLNGGIGGNILFSTGSGTVTERLRITSAGLVGIGTSSAGARLHVRSSADDSTPVIRAQSNNQTQHVDLGFYYINYDNGATSSPLEFQIDGSTKMALSATGLGIGTTSPGQALSVAGNISSSAVGTNYVASSSQGVTTSYLITDTSGGNIQVDGAWPIRFTTNSNERARIDSSGRLLVGTSSNDSNALAVVQGYVGLTSGQGVLALRLGTTRPTGADVGIGSIRFESTSNTSSNYHYASISAFSDGASSSDTDIPGRLVFSTTADGASSPTERMRIKSNGTINFSNVAVYADNAAATTGGLAVGDVYRTSTGQLMIRY